MNKFLIKLFLYNIRWQLSTPTLAIFSALTVSYMTNAPLAWPTIPQWCGAIVANLIGANIFIWVDRLIFKK